MECLSAAKKLFSVQQKRLSCLKVFAFGFLFSAFLEVENFNSRFSGSYCWYPTMYRVNIILGCIAFSPLSYVSGKHLTVIDEWLRPEVKSVFSVPGVPSGSQKIRKKGYMCWNILSIKSWMLQKKKKRYCCLKCSSLLWRTSKNLRLR